ncbi:fibronectin type III domain-containing protein [Candidatus Sumerlaeota bacterium]|nr:fibronectin type III domain-containing protein [Candidatus Sumerlaeota bacterium]
MAVLDTIGELHPLPFIDVSSIEFNFITTSPLDFTINDLRFSRSVPVGVVTPGDGVIQGAPSDIITVTYFDPDDGTGNPRSTTAVVTLDCVAPLISNVAVTDIFGTEATVTLNTSESASILVRFGTVCGDLTEVRLGSGGGVSHRIKLSGLLPSTRYFFTVEATDTVRNRTVEDNGRLCFSFTTDAEADFFTELFAFPPGTNALQNLSLAFVPSASDSFYDPCREFNVNAFPVDPNGGTLLSLGDDDSVRVELLDRKRVSLYGVSYDALYVGSNGYITFGAPDTDFSESLSDHFQLPRISGFFKDLDPRAGGRISWKQGLESIAITFEDVPEFGGNDTVNFQIEIFFAGALDGTIKLTYLGLEASRGLSGLSAGDGLPAGFVTRDIGSYGNCDFPTDSARGWELYE